jgi:hypothetical protein
MIHRKTPEKTGGNFKYPTPEKVKYQGNVKTGPHNKGK